MEIKPPTKPSKIQVLSPEVVNQIAAGEVVERPSHLVKELIENSLDAGSDSIEIHISSGGRNVRIIDNGNGISKENLNLALKRFATSKISQADDLWKLSSFGFRGEALASIASVSELKLSSRDSESAHAYQITSQYGEMSEPLECSLNKGTSIEIQKLFENTPARLKFLKSETAETTAIKNTIKAMALAFDQVEFRLYVDAQSSLLLPKTSRLQRAKALLGEKDLYLHQEDDIQIIFSSPFQVQKSTKQIYVFVQDRWIQDRSIQAAIMEGYRNLLMHGEYPSVVLYLQVPAADIDVNIHPTKSEVRFQNPSMIFRKVVGALRRALEQAPWNPKGSGKVESLAGEMQNQSLSQSEDLSRVTHQEPVQESFIHQPFEQVNFAVKGIPLAVQTPQDFESIDSRIISQGSTTYIPTPGQTGFWRNLQVLSQSKLTYILAQSSEALYLIDQHAAHERVNFEKILLSWESDPLPSQVALFPLGLQLSPEKAEALLALTQDLKRLGIQIEQLGPQEVGVLGWPTILNEEALRQSLLETADEAYLLGHSFKFENSLRHRAATMACHSSIRAGQALSHDEMKTLLNEMDLFPLSTFCPHGRPVYLKYSFVYLEKEFGRRN